MWVEVNVCDKKLFSERVTINQPRSSLGFILILMALIEVACHH